MANTPLRVSADDTNRQERLAAIRQYTLSGREGGAGIVSSTAGEGQWLMPAFDEAGNILIRLAVVGDVTLDDRLDGDDYYAIDSAFLAAAGDEEPAADLSLDGMIDGRDYLLLDGEFLRAAVSQQPAALPAVQSSVPFSTRPIAEALLGDEMLPLGMGGRQLFS